MTPLLTGILSDVLDDLREQERRSSLENPQSPLTYPAEWLLDLLNGGRTDSGMRVSERTEFQVATFLACVDLISGAIASRPLHILERVFLKNGRAAHKVAYDHAYSDLLEIEPNAEMSAFVFKKALLVHMLAWGNCYEELQRDGGNRVVAIWPRNPAKTRILRVSQRTTLQPAPWRPFPVTIPAGGLVYRTTDHVEAQDNYVPGEETGEGRLIAPDDMLHVPGITFDGRVGESTVALARQLLGQELAAEKFGGKYFANFAKPGGLILLPANVSNEQREQARQSWQQAQGGENSHRVAVMPAGSDFKPMSHTPQEAQANELRSFLRNQICSIFHVPPHMVGDVDKGRANTEQLAQEFVQFALAQHLEAIKQELKRKLFPNPGVGRAPRNRYFVDFDLHDLLRPDAASREKFLATGRQWGILSINDGRAYEGLNPIDEPWADEHWKPVNMQDAANPVVVPAAGDNGQGSSAADAGDGEPTGTNDPEGRAAAAYERAYGRLFSDAFGRVMARQKRDFELFKRAFGPVLWTLRQVFADELKATPGQGSDCFIVEYLKAMLHRSAEWKKEDEAGEFRRAITEIRAAVAREPKETS